MSFILEALKKSEQQRQKNTASPKKVRTRRLSLNQHHSIHRLKWLLVAVLLLLISGGLWHFSASGSKPGTPLVVERVESPSPADNQVAPPKPAVIAEPDNIPKIAESEPRGVEQAVLKPAEPALQFQPIVETAPVPRAFSRPATSDTKAPATVIMQPETITSQALPPQNEYSTLPLYMDLSMELRERMPRLDMSMHFYAPTPQHRLVRINNSLLREGDWVNGEVEIIEITPSGVNLDFLGKTFKLRKEN